MPRILVTNDDGYRSDGILALAKALEALGPGTDVTIVAPVQEASDRQFAHGRLTLVPASHAASFDSKPLVLTAIEFAIVKGFLARPLHVLGRDAVMANAYQSNIHVSERTVDSHIRNIRAKLAAVGCVDAIETVHGVGFRLGRCGG